MSDHKARKQPVEIFVGYLLHGGHCLRVDFHAPINATKAEKDAAFLAALAEAATIDYLSIGTEDAP